MKGKMKNSPKMMGMKSMSVPNSNAYILEPTRQIKDMNGGGMTMEGKDLRIKKGSR